MAFDGIIFGLLFGFLRRGSIKNFASIRLKYGWMFPLLLLIQIFVFVFQSKLGWLEAISNYTFAAVYIIGFIFLWMNRKERGFLLVLAGAFLNFLVMIVNGGRMPVSIEAAEVALDPFFVEILRQGITYGKHTAMTAQTHLTFLGDIIPLTKPYYKQQVISIGDVIESIGIMIYIQTVMLRGKSSHNHVAAANQA
ncbi:DUF5317 domain-containing protein [Paenibacillus chartarius]|uniref:DUF5317 domain-containing protein n=1 Tax=Paenibacillus chartarius TaxID=747481 RepID=A0ABV6DVT2_9BACL